MDREKVMKGLEACSIGLYCPEDECPYAEDKIEIEENCIAALARDALELLKAQEPIEPVVEKEYEADADGEERAYFMYYCGKCNQYIEKDQAYCDKCGQAVKWDD